MHVARVPVETSDLVIGAGLGLGLGLGSRDRGWRREVQPGRALATLSRVPVEANHNLTPYPNPNPNPNPNPSPNHFPNPNPNPNPDPDPNPNLVDRWPLGSVHVETTSHHWRVRGCHLEMWGRSSHSVRALGLELGYP